mmetsp:Transcript_8557/g.10811  ORF Transcript_8557/g.10811 Transcript_8557/m.10811 type:complete len:832 (-) Transcript_8557:892-3387(-)
MELQKDLIPDHIDDLKSTNSDDVILPSFRDIKRKTLQSLYGIDEKNPEALNYALLMDKSPKGSVDEGIRSLVDLINAHPSYATLSSCSGRISLFDPLGSNHNNARDQSNSNEREYDTSDIEGERAITSNSGKGQGTWLISSHATIEADQLLGALDAHSNIFPSGNALMLKHEPLLLHIAASNISRARQLLTIACNLGFRESGLVVTPKRITVAIRSHSLSLTIPIASSGSLRPGNDFLKEVVNEANRRFILNEEKLKALEKTVRSELFQSEIQSFRDMEIKDINFSIKGYPLPELNLWGHSAVSISSQSETELIVLGGYGSGPLLSEKHTNNSTRSKCTRSNKLFSLKRKGVVWDEYWEEIEQKNHETVRKDLIKQEEDHQFFGINVRCVPFTAREGHSSCILPLHNLRSNVDDEKIGSHLVATFGGRSSPAKPNNDLLLMETNTRPISFFKPINTRGECPSPRWGHSFIALSGINGRLGLVVGGRNEKRVLGSVHVLSYMREVDECSRETTHFHWERLETIETIPRFNHSSILISTCLEKEEDRILVFGGQKSLHLFEDVVKNRISKENETNLPISTIVLGKNKVSEDQSNEVKSLPYIGSSCCLLPELSCSKDKNIFIRAGGLSSEVSASYKSFDIICSQDATMHDIDCNIDSTIDVGSLVHHVSLAVASLEKQCQSCVLLGGGIPTIFGESFARSYHLMVELNTKSNSMRKKGGHAVFLVAKREKIKAKSDKKTELIHVLYVENKKAKELKTKLEAQSFLNKNYRMRKADSSAQIDDVSNHIAVPITQNCYDIISRGNSDESCIPWLSLVKGSGMQIMPYSTVVLGRK